MAKSKRPVSERPAGPRSAEAELHQAVDAFTFEAALLFFRMRLAA